MTRFLTLMFTMLMTLQTASAMNVDEFMDKHIAPISDFVAGIIFFPITICGSKVPLIIFWILAAGIFFTIYFRGMAIWGFKHAIDVVAKPANKGDGCGEVSSFQALATALSGTIGIGSIAGVAISISIGGPGAAFWIFVGALLGMSIKFVEATLAVKYRRFNLDGSVSGGPMHYIAHGLTRRKMRWLGQPLSVLFAILCIGGGLTGAELAIYMKSLGAEPQIVEMVSKENTTIEDLHMHELEKQGIPVHFNTKALEIKEDGVRCETPDGETFIAGNTIALALGQRPLSDQALEMNTLAEEFYMIGDCRAPRNIMTANKEGWTAGKSIGMI